jgi:uncharacterized protein DUF6983
MSTLELQTRTDGVPHYEMRTKLDGVDYRFVFRFGERRLAWVFDMFTLAEDEEVISGQLVLMTPQNLLRRSTSLLRPPGSLFGFSLKPGELTGSPFELPGLYELGAGGRCRLYYRESI